MSPREQARNIIISTFNVVPHWKISTQFVGIQMGNCTVYMPTTKLKKDRVIEFRDYMQKLYLMTQHKKINLDKSAES